MGQFSWLYSDTGKQMVNGRCKKSYLLVPSEFGGGYVLEECYGGYGMMGCYDVYDLVADWNKAYISTNNIRIPERSRWVDEKFYLYAVEQYEKDCQRLMDFVDNKPDDYMVETYGEHWKREVGINIACRDEDNAKLRYPIKIVENESSVYETCKPSNSDPNQGWES